MAKVARHVEARDVGDGAGELNAGRTAADDNEIERGVRAGFKRLAFCKLKREQHTAANLGCIFN